MGVPPLEQQLPWQTFHTTETRRVLESQRRSCIPPDKRLGLSIRLAMSLMTQKRLERCSPPSESAANEEHMWCGATAEYTRRMQHPTLPDKQNATPDGPLQICLRHFPDYCRSESPSPHSIAFFHKMHRRGFVASPQPQNLSTRNTAK